MPISRGNRHSDNALSGKRGRKDVALDAAVANKMGLAGWILHGSHTPNVQGTAAQQAAEKEELARKAMKARNLPRAQNLVGQAINHRKDALSARENSADTAGVPKSKIRHRQKAAHQHAVGHLSGVQQAMGDVASAYFHEVRKIEGRWPRKTK